MDDLGRIGAFLERDHETIDRIFERYQAVKDENDTASIHVIGSMFGSSGFWSSYQHPVRSRS